MIRRAAAAAAFFMVLSAGAAAGRAASPGSDTVPTRSTRSAHEPSNAAGLEEKLAQIRANQERIQELIKEALQQLGYAKTRATIR